MVQGSPQTAARLVSTPDPPRTEGLESRLLQGNVGEDGRKSAQQWWYRLHLMHIMEVSMVYSVLTIIA